MHTSQTRWDQYTLLDIKAFPGVAKCVAKLVAVTRRAKCQSVQHRAHGSERAVLNELRRCPDADKMNKKHYNIKSTADRGGSET
jgi:hypothetical protein